MKVRIGLAAALLLAAAGVSAQTVDEIVAKNVAARGGLAKLKAIETARMTGTMTMGGGMEAGVRIEFRRPRMLRTEYVVQGMTGIQAYDGTRGWQVMPFMGKKDPEPMSADDLKESEEQSDIEGELVDWKEKGHTVELLGKDKADGTDAWKLRVTLKGGTVKTEWLDARTCLEIREESRRTVQGNEVTIVTDIGDYREVGGLMVPHSFESRVTGGAGGGQKISLTSVAFNVPVDASRFRMPGPAPAPSAEPPRPASRPRPPSL